MRGTLRESNSHRPRGDSPSPQPSPRKRGEGAQRHRGCTHPIFRSNKLLHPSIRRCRSGTRPRAR
ncbi:hypothetical protein EAS61_24780 [Bradyrhizobium zhanjiangense]|uniref:Uncharacterized protein n=1 Tax=Bradyrhizobium zhanjiangense TaxID=1325107 RepID=A0A4V1KVS0_9BRAD|nr:hypothetical protein EAS61_24780 [Bradyrhizobium zhanjiangense]RXG99724.1 hypothetical protein EAS62_00600 [Bradyrhizobium zhanjiangense]